MRDRILTVIFGALLWTGSIVAFGIAARVFVELFGVGFVWLGIAPWPPAFLR